MAFTLHDFVVQSNMIEGIFDTTDDHIEAHIKFLDIIGRVEVIDLMALVGVLQPDARLRIVPTPGIRTTVGHHVAPIAGPEIRANLESVLTISDPWQQHVAYETLHPFTDGNGRSGRALWLHNMVHTRGGFPTLGFLHTFYYQTLSNTRL